jgi:uncharacterized membrane protein
VTPTAINYTDEVVGGFYDLTTFVLHGFVWKGGTATLYDFPGAMQTQIRGVNDAGRMVGDYSNSQGQEFGFYLAPSGQTLTFSMPGAYSTFATGINNHGAVVGYSEPYLGGTDTGFVKQGTTYTTIQYPGAVSTYPEAINDAGAVVGWYYDGSTEHGFLEYRGNYTKLEPVKASSSMARGINVDGEIVGEYRPGPQAQGEGFTYVNGAYNPFVYPTATYTELTGVNALGDRVGDAVTGSSGGFLTGPGFVVKCR